MLIMPSGPDQSDKLSVLHGYDGSASPDSPQALEWLTVQLEYFDHLVLG